MEIGVVSIADGTDPARQVQPRSELDGVQAELVHQWKGIVHGCSTDGADLRLVVHWHIRYEHPRTLLFVNGLGASWSDMRFIPGDTSTNSLKLGAVLEFGLIITQIGTAVVLYPLARRQSKTISLGYVSARTMESVFAAIGLISIVSCKRGGVVGVSYWRRRRRARCSRRVLGEYLRMDVPVGPRTRCRNRERLNAGLLDVPIGTRAASHGAAGSHRWPGADHFLRTEAVRRVRGRYGDCWPADTAGGRVGAVARQLLRVEGFRPESPIAKPQTTMASSTELLAASGSESTLRLGCGGARTSPLWSCLRRLQFRQSQPTIYVEAEANCHLRHLKSPVGGARGLLVNHCDCLRHHLPVVVPQARQIARPLYRRLCCGK